MVAVVYHTILTLTGHVRVPRSEMRAHGFKPGDFFEVTLRKLEQSNEIQTAQKEVEEEKLGDEDGTKP